MLLKDIKKDIPKEIYQILDKEVKELRPCQVKAINAGLLLEKNLLVIGGDILSVLRERKIWNIEDIFQKLKKIKFIDLNQYYNSITFLWLSDIIRVDEYHISLKQKNFIK